MNKGKGAGIFEVRRIPRWRINPAKLGVKLGERIKHHLGSRHRKPGKREALPQEGKKKQGGGNHHPFSKGKKRARA